MKDLIKKIIPPVLLDWYHLGLAFLSAVLYLFPSKGMVVIGVTGTKGKSTVVEFCHKIFQEAGFKVASLSSIRFKINEKEWPNRLKMTMPGRFSIQKFLKQAKKAGCKYVVLEVTSEGIIQSRHRFIDFDTAVFTNLSPEHIERHGGFENYREAKGRLFRSVNKTHILNLDDKNNDYFLQFSAKEKWGYGLELRPAIQGLEMLRIQNYQLLPDGLRFLIDNTEFTLGMLGEFNVSNALASICVGLSQGISLDICKKALEKIKGLPGRMERVIKEPFEVIVDYAHTPDALEKVYQTFGGKKLICVLGSAGGGRDKWKRPKMGEIAVQYCDQIILTNEDPYNEDPNEIIKEISKGVRLKTLKILDRRDAIKKALKLASPGDAIVITGKGCEPWMCVAHGRKISWDDRQIVREEFTKLKIPLAPQEAEGFPSG